jgi:cytochrome c556
MQRSNATLNKNLPETKGLRRSAKLPALCALVLCSALTACSGSDESSAAEANAVVLPVSLNEVMVALINKAADPLWAAVWASPQSDQDWRELEHLAYQVELGGALLKYPGTGPLDQAWTSNPDWQRLAEQLSQDGKRAVNAVRSRNMDLMERAGGQLVETCESCHRAFKPDLPTMDMFGELPARPPVSLP